MYDNPKDALDLYGTEINCRSLLGMVCGTHAKDWKRSVRAYEASINLTGLGSCQ